ncbi:MAG: hypothetical protein H0U57_01265 [Tatlockia sp.]|nr:hypothetical protein [Tatlockia sp.]
MKKFFISFIVLMLMNIAQAKEQLVIDSSLLNEAKKIPHTGRLSINLEHNGFVFLKVSQEFKTTLFPILYKNLNLKDKNCLVPNNNPEGIHISIFSPKSLTTEQIKQLPIGRDFDFYISSIMKFSKKRADGSNVDWYVLKVDSEEIDKIRKKFIPSLVTTDHLHISMALSKYDNEGKCSCMCELLLMN